MPSSKQKKVAVWGAGGIGKHHAKWWQLEGADVCAILGSSPASAAATAEQLRGMFGFSGRAYDSLEKLLAEEKPDIVDVCTPNGLHFAHVCAALAAGCDVLCEKPLVFDPELNDEDNLEHARFVVQEAARLGQSLAMCTQYAVAAEECLRLGRERGMATPVTAYHGTLISPTRGRPPRPLATWVDLAPHMIAVLQILAPGGVPDWESAVVTTEGHRAEAGFDWRTPDGEITRAVVTTHHRDEEPVNVRRMEANGCCFDILGQNGADGIFCAKYVTPFGEFLRDDSMRLTIRRFLQGTPSFGGTMALENMSLMVRFRRMLAKEST